MPSLRKGSCNLEASPARGRLLSFWDVTLLYSATAGIVSLGLLFAAEFVSSGDASSWMERLSRFDAGNYVRIVRESYDYNPFDRSTVACFPVFPLLGAAISECFALPPTAALLAVSNLSFVAALGTFTAYWGSRRQLSATMSVADRSALSRSYALLLMALLPTSFFYIKSQMNSNAINSRAIWPLRRRPFPRPFITMFVPMLLMSGTASADMLRSTIVSRLRHQEELVKSLSCDLEIVVHPTEKKAIAQIRDVCARQRRAGDAVNYIISANSAKARSKKLRWWREGVKERIESTMGSDKSREIQAFDGALIRSVQSRRNGTTGAIHSTASAYWNDSNRITLGYLLFYAYGKPYSSWVEDSASCKITVARGEEVYHVSLEDPPTARRMDIVLDEKYRIVRRDNFVKFAVDREFRLNERHALGDYQAHRDASGETIWIPRVAEIAYYMGVADDGTPIKYQSQTITVSGVQINSDLDDGLFALTFPDNVEVWEGVHGLGWLEKGIDPENPLATKAPTWKIGLAAVSAIALLLLAYKLVRQSRRVPNTAV